MQVVTYGTAEETVQRENTKQAVNAVKIGATIMAGLMAAAMIAAMSASAQVRADVCMEAGLLLARRCTIRILEKCVEHSSPETGLRDQHGCDQTGNVMPSVSTHLLCKGNSFFRS
jgi:hypothetical protein